MKLHETRQAFEFNLEWRMVPPIAPPAKVPPIAPPAKVLPLVRNVKIINVSGNSVGIIRGLADSPIRIFISKTATSPRRGASNWSMRAAWT
jgi:hypothetical protein